MIIRIVRMVFQEGKTEEFQDIFNHVKTKISAFEGCEHLELYEDANETNTFYTLSHWQSVMHLDAYRKSQLFTETWSKTKVLFADRPQAFSLSELKKD